jgi:hypothetical protein
MMTRRFDVFICRAADGGLAARIVCRQSAAMQDRNSVQSGRDRAISDRSDPAGAAPGDGTVGERLQRNRRGIWLALALTLAAAAAVLLSRLPA